jgi:hypothetical protein
MSQTTPLSSGTLNGQTLSIQLVESGKDVPPVIVVRWPEKPTVCPLSGFDQLVATAMRILSSAVVQLAALRVHKRL